MAADFGSGAVGSGGAGDCGAKVMRLLLCDCLMAGERGCSWRVYVRPGARSVWEACPMLNEWTLKSMDGGNCMATT